MNATYRNPAEGTPRLTSLALSALLWEVLEEEAEKGSTFDELCPIHGRKGKGSSLRQMLEDSRHLPPALHCSAGRGSGRPPDGLFSDSDADGDRRPKGP